MYATRFPLASKDYILLKLKKQELASTCYINVFRNQHMTTKTKICQRHNS